MSKIDVKALWGKACDPEQATPAMDEFARLILEEAVKVCRTQKLKAYTADDEIVNATCDACATAIRELAP